MKPEAGRNAPPGAPHPQDDLSDFRRRLEVLDTLAEVVLDRKEPHSRDVAAVIDGVALVYDDFDRLCDSVTAWFRQNCPALGLDMGGPVHVSVPLNQVLADLDSKAHVLAIRELAARIFNVRLDLEEAASFEGTVVVSGENAEVVHLEHLEAAVDRAQAALAVIARDLLLSVGVTPENGGDDAAA